jgi:hypothetical protein
MEGSEGESAASCCAAFAYAVKPGPDADGRGPGIVCFGKGYNCVQRMSLDERGVVLVQLIRFCPWCGRILTGG